MKKTINARRPVPALLLTTAMVLSLSACVPVAIGAGAAVGVSAAKEGGLRNAATDTSIRLQITDLWLKHDVNMYRRLDMTVKEGRVLITGTVPTPDARVDAIRLAWQADGVREVINEINVDKSSGFTGYATDVWITSQLKSKMLMDKYIQSINYTVDTVNGTIYLMGIAQDQKELDRVINHARSIGRVRNVVSYVRLRGETPPALQTPNSGRRAATTPATAPVSGRPIAEEMTDVNGTGWSSTTGNSAMQPGPADRQVTSENLLPP